MQRRLAAILAADMVGYSRLIERDETGTIERLSTDREALIDPAIAAHGGSIVRLAGDGALVEFSSVVEAAQCAIDIQRGMERRNADRPTHQRAVFRIGINFGDIVVEKDNLHGEGINVAARLESLAPPGGIFLSEEAARQIDGKISESVEFVAVRKVKNIERAVRVWQIRESAQSGAPPTQPPGLRTVRGPYVAVAAFASMALSGLLVWYQPWAPKDERAPQDSLTQLPIENSSIAVLPFRNMSGEPEQEYFSDGISENIITDLSRLSNLDVIARNSSFTYKGAPVKVQEIASDLGVRYVLEGSVQKGENRLRISAQLIDATSGHQIWAERYDRQLTDIFTLQDDIARKIVTALAIQLGNGADRSFTRAATDSFEAYDLFLQAQAADRVSGEGIDLAIARFREAISRDPDFARAYGALAVTLSRQVATGLSNSPAETLERALSLARKAVVIEPDSAHAQWALGYVFMRRRQFDQALVALERATTLSPSYADGYALMALIRSNLGQPEEAIRLIHKAMALNPHYPREYLYNLGRNYYALGDYPQAIEYLLEALERNQVGREPRMFLAASYVRLGQLDAAEWEVEQLRLSDPQYTLSHIDKTLSLGDEDLQNRLLSDLRSAGMSE